jgi:hypothetical protein
VTFEAARSELPGSGGRDADLDASPAGQPAAAGACGCRSGGGGPGAVDLLWGGVSDEVFRGATPSAGYHLLSSEDGEEAPRGPGNLRGEDVRRRRTIRGPPSHGLLQLPRGLCGEGRSSDRARRYFARTTAVPPGAVVVVVVVSASRRNMASIKVPRSRCRRNQEAQFRRNEALAVGRFRHRRSAQTSRAHAPMLYPRTRPTSDVTVPVTGH